jgi:carboxyl-terminal processing protease
MQIWTFGACVAAAATLAGAQQEPTITPEAVFLEAWRVTANAFYDPGMHGADWDAVRTELQPKAASAASDAELSSVINDALSRLHASHTEHYFKDQREYYELLDVFYPDGVPARPGFALKPGPLEYVGIGLAAATIDGKVFASDVYDGGPAAAAGIMAGDQLLGVEDGPWGDVAPFREREGKPTRIRIQRTADPASQRTVEVEPRRIQPRELFLRAERASARVIEHDGKKIGYVRIRSYAHSDYQDLLKELLAKELAAADGLIIDIRAGWGGASPSYMDIFNPDAPVMTFRKRDGTETEYAPTWRRPVAMIIDGGSRSGKEVIAYAFKKHHVGTLVGERTAGAVLAGTPRALADGSVLYIAIHDVLIDGEHLEGIGVEPDVKAPRHLPYCEGRDEQVEAAIASVAAMIGKENP